MVLNIFLIIPQIIYKKNLSSIKVQESENHFKNWLVNTIFFFLILGRQNLFVVLGIPLVALRPQLFVCLEICLKI